MDYGARMYDNQGGLMEESLMLLLARIWGNHLVKKLLKSETKISMRISLENKNSTLYVKTNIENDENFNEQISLYHKILMEELFGEKINLFTVEPQPYSFGYEIESVREVLNVGDKVILLNKDTTCDSDLLLDIIQSEEFRRTLLFIGEIQSQEMTIVHARILQYFETKFTRFDIVGRLYFTETDGNTLCLYNSRLTKDQVFALIQSV